MWWRYKANIKVILSFQHLQIYVDNIYTHSFQYKTHYNKFHLEGNWSWSFLYSNIDVHHTRKGGVRFCQQNQISSKGMVKKCVGFILKILFQNVEYEHIENIVRRIKKPIIGNLGYFNYPSNVFIYIGIPLGWNGSSKRS